nr:hypothetical protein [Tanacetum cinerariifolium]
MRVFNKRTKIVEETLNIRFLKNAPNVKGNRLDWLFDIDSVTISMNYEPVVAEKQTNGIAGTKDNIVAGPKDSVVDAGKNATEVDESRVLDNGRQDDQVTKIQVYVDDNILGSTKKELSTEFEKLMHDKFQMSSMGELSFFLELQVQQKSDGIFISQEKYDAEAEDVDVLLYRSMIGSLMYLTASRPDNTFSVCACTRDSPFDLEAYSNSDYARASLDRKSITGGCQFFSRRLISWQCKKQPIVANSTIEAERHLKLEDFDGISTIPNANIFEQLALIGYASNSDKLTFQKGHFSPQWVPTPPYDLSLPEGHTPGGDDGSLTLNELTVLCTTLSNKVEILKTDLKLTKQTYGAAFTKLIKKVKKLEKTFKTSQGRRPAKNVISDNDMVLEDSSKQERMIEYIDQDAGVILVTPTKVSSQEDQPEDRLGVPSVTKILADATRVHTYSRKRREVSTGSGRVSTASRIISTAEETVSTVGVSVPDSTTDMVQESTSAPRATKDKGAGGLKSDAEEELDQGISKKRKTIKASGSVQV